MSSGTFNLLAGNVAQQAVAASAAGTLWELMRRFNRLPDMARADVDLLAGDVANFILAELVQAHAQASDESDYRYTHRVYMTAAAVGKGHVPPVLPGGSDPGDHAHAGRKMVEGPPAPRRRVMARASADCPG
ncbi:hypothetical protein E05_45350 [Plautia stali symbiont]|nr:hypothetical protein E05_45350 [Plautia stali symbiont]